VKIFCDLIEESVAKFDAQLRKGTGAFYHLIDSEKWRQDYRTEITRVVKATLETK